MPVARLELRVYVHATEDREKVLQALREIVPEEYWGEAEVEEETYHGHYGNPIVVITVTFHGETASRVLDSILARLGEADRGALSVSLEDRVDKEGTLYFRLSKQDAFLGRLILYEADDVVRVSVGFHGRRKDAIREYKRRLGERD